MTNFAKKYPLVLTTLLCAMTLTACSKSDTTQDGNADQVTTTNGKVITIYSSRNEQLIKPLLDKYSNKTGTTIELITDKAGPLMARLEAEGANTPADMLLTVDAGNLWQASNKGLLQQFTSPTIEKNVPERYRDPENRWTGLSLRARTIFYNPKKVNVHELYSYSDLSHRRWRKKLCLRTSKKVYNQSLVASMIYNLGADKTSRAVKGWVKNLATDVFSDDTSLLKAIASGQCQVGIANTYYYGRILEENPDFNVKIFWANQKTSGVHMNISGAGVVANSDNSAGALDLIEWLSSDEAQEVYSSADKEYPVNPNVEVSPMLKEWGAFLPDPMNVSEFGKMQSDAIQLMDKAGYK
ncbi:MAG: extracellular solute-binding protein [Moraxellaceae bacterium]|nr:extracellular solute-binding protein [Moraxellaceae bacterium]